VYVFDRKPFQAVGADFFAHVLWDKYIEFEVSQQEPARVTNIFHRVLEIPLIQVSLPSLSACVRNLLSSMHPVICW
jgi:hypothetical protein